MGLDNGFSSRVACDFPLQCRSNIRLSIVVCTNVLHYTAYNQVSTRLRFKWTNAKSQIPRHEKWRINVFVNLVIISVINKFLSYSSQKYHDIMITSSHYHIVNMIVIHTSLRPMCIHLLLLSVLKSSHSFMIIGVYSTYQYQQNKIYSWWNPGNYYKSTHRWIYVMGTDILSTTHKSYTYTDI